MEVHVTPGNDRNNDDDDDYTAAAAAAAADDDDDDDDDDEDDDDDDTDNDRDVGVCFCGVPPKTTRATSDNGHGDTKTGHVLATAADIVSGPHFILSVVGDDRRCVAVRYVAWQGTDNNMAMQKFETAEVYMYQGGRWLFLGLKSEGTMRQAYNYIRTTCMHEL